MLDIDKFDGLDNDLEEKIKNFSRMDRLD